MKYNQLLFFGVIFLLFTIPVYTQTDNTPPTADAGVGRNVSIEDETRLSGSGSDADNDPLTFKWQLIDKPGGSSASLTQGNTPSPYFTPDLEGSYEFSLRTNDGNSFSIPSKVNITAKTPDGDNNKPLSYANVNRNVNIGEEETLAGFGFDEEGNDLSQEGHYREFID